MSIILVSSTSDDLWLFIMAVFKSCKLETFSRVHFFGKNPNPDSESKNGFFVSLAKSKKGSNESMRDEDSVD